MSTASSYDDDPFGGAILRSLKDLQLEEQRETILRYLEERRANGIKPSTLLNNANALRAFCLHIGQKRLEETTRQDVSAT